MNNSVLKKIAGVAITGTAIPGSVSCAQSEPQRPNVMMFIVDDWGAHDLSLTGSGLYETPNIDALAGESVEFRQAYVAYPRSVPSRYSIFTGRHCARPQQGARSDDRKVLDDSYCIAMPFHSAGYQTFICGKWHLSDGVTMPEDKGFDINIGAGRAGATSSYFAPFNKEGVTDTDRLIYGMEDAVPGEYLTDYMCRKTVDYLNGIKDSDKPFFAVCSFYAVHTPIQAKKEMSDRYRKKIKEMGLGPDPMMKEEAGDCKTQQDHPVYAAMIESVDEAVGNVLQTLKETGKYDNTVIVLISDHGGLSNRGEGNKRELATTNLPLKAGKGHLYEGGIRVPFLIHMPGQEDGKSTDVPAVSLDLLPTLTDLCGVPVDPDAELDGKSLKKVLDTGRDSELENRELFWHKASERPTNTGDYVSTALRSGRYKLIDFYYQGRVELYDLANDPGEHNNIAAQKPEIVEKMMTRIGEWRKDMNVMMAEEKTMHLTDSMNKNNKNAK